MKIPFAKIYFPNWDGIPSLKEISGMDTIKDRDLIESITWKNTTKGIDNFTIVLYNKDLIYSKLKNLVWKSSVYLYLGYWDTNKDEQSPSDLGTVITGIIDSISMSKEKGLEKLTLTCFEVSNFLGTGFGLPDKEDSEKKSKSIQYWANGGVVVELYGLDGKKTPITIPRKKIVVSAEEKEGSDSSTGEAKEKFYAMRDSAIVREIAIRNSNLQAPDYVDENGVLHTKKFIDSFFIMETESAYKDNDPYFKEKSPLSQSIGQSDLEVCMKLAKRNNFEFFISGYEAKTPTGGRREFKRCLFFVPPRLDIPFWDFYLYDPVMGEDLMNKNNMETVKIKLNKRNTTPEFKYWLSTEAKNPRSFQQKQIEIIRNMGNGLMVRTDFE